MRQLQCRFLRKLLKYIARTEQASELKIFEMLFSFYDCPVILFFAFCQEAKEYAIQELCTVVNFCRK